MSWRAWWRRFVENVLPWYDVADARRRKARSDAIVTELHVNTRNAEAVRKDYEDMDRRLRIRSQMGYILPSAPFRPNLDRFGMPRDYATYVWLLYKRVVTDDSPARQAFLHGPRTGGVPDFGQQVSMR